MRARSAWTGWFAIAAVAAFPSVEAVRTLIQRPHVVLYGDQALLELGVRRAARLDQLVGPYSRNGFHHPGPAVLYLLAPFVRLLEPSGPGLYLGAVAINAAALIATVSVFWRLLGPLAALWAAAAIDLFCLCLGVGTLREPWNPYLVVAPMILFVVLWAAGVSSRSAAVWALVVGSYQVQTHIATAPVVIAMSVVLMVRLVALRRPGHDESAGHGRWGPASVTGVVALALLWLPPVVELWRDRPNNLQLMWDFFTSPHVTPPLGKALQVSASAVSIMPFGNHDYVLTLSRSPVDIAAAASLLVVGLVGALSIGRRRRERMSGPLVVSAALGAIIGTLALTQTDGPVYPYFAVWMAYVPLSVLLGLGAAILGPSEPEPAGAHEPERHRAQRRSPPPRPLVLGICSVVALIVAASTIRSDLSTGPVSTTTGSGPWPPGNARTPQGRQRTITDTVALTRAAEGVLSPSDRSVTFTIGSSAVWPYVAGMILELDERGVQSTVGPASWELYFGHERAPDRPVSVTFSLYLSNDAAGLDTSRSTPIARVDDAVLTYERAGP